MDGSYVNAHQHSASAATAVLRAIGKSRGGCTSKIHLATDAYGLPNNFETTGGEILKSQNSMNIVLILPTRDEIQVHPLEGSNPT